LRTKQFDVYQGILPGHHEESFTKAYLLIEAFTQRLVVQNYLKGCTIMKRSITALAMVIICIVALTTACGGRPTDNPTDDPNTQTDANNPEAGEDMPSPSNGYITIQDENYDISLTELELPSLSLTNDDIADLQLMTNLTRLNLYSNLISDLTPLSGLTNLEVLILDRNQVSDIAPLSGLTNLKELDLANTLVTEVSELSNLTNLSTLFLSNTQVSDITPLSNLTNLRELISRNTEVSDLAPLSSLSNLEHLDMRGNPIDDWSPVSHVDDVPERH